MKLRWIRKVWFRDFGDTDSVIFRIDFLPKVCYSYYSAAVVPSSFVCHCQLSNLIWLSLNSSFCKSKLAPSNGAASFVSLWWGRILPPRCLEWAMCLLLLLLLLLMSMMVLHQSCCVCCQGVLPRTAESHPILVWVSGATTWQKETPDHLPCICQSKLPWVEMEKHTDLV